MIGIFVLFIVVAFVLWIGVMLTGALLAAGVWLFIKIPFALLLWAVGAILCCTILLIPLGMNCFGLGLRMILPG